MLEYCRLLIQHIKDKVHNHSCLFFRKANLLQDEATRSQLESFIKNNLAAWGEDADINKIMSSLSEIKENSNASSWSVGQNENLARLYEAYRRSERSIRQSLPQAIRNLLEKLAQFMNKVYGTLKDTVPLNENIAKAYDSLMGFEDMTSDTKRVESQGAFREFQGISKETESNILFQSTMPDDFSEQIDNIAEEDIGKSRNKTITFATETPQLFRSLGFKNLPVEMFKDKIARAIFLDPTEPHGHKDSVDSRIIKEVAKTLGDPIAVFKSDSVQGSIVALYDIDDLKQHLVMASFAPNKKRSYYEINSITAIYGKDNENVYKNWIAKGLLQYYDDKKTRKLADRLQLPSDVSLSENKVLTKSQLVKGNVNGNFSTDSDSILYQIVNHGTGAYFDKFDMEFISSGAGSQAFGLGFYFTDDEKIAESYANLTYTEESKSSDINYYKGILERAEKALEEGRKQYELDENNQEELREDARRRINEKYERIKKDGGKLPKILEYKYPGMTIDEWREKALSEVDTKTYHTVNIKSLEEKVENAKRHLSTIEQKETGTPYIYKVDIPDRGFLQWDKVIPQSLIRKIVNNRVNEDSSLDFNDMMMDFSYLETGADLYNYLYGQDPQHEIETVRELQKAGIKGIKYRAGQNVSLPNGANPKAYNYVVFNPSDAQIVEQRNLTTGQSILFQDKFLEDIDNISDIESAEALAREEYWSSRRAELSKDEKATAENLFDIEASLPEGWENIYESEAEDRLEQEIALEKALSDVDETVANWDKLKDMFNDGPERGLIKGVGNLNISYRLFTEGNDPGIEYLGNDIQRDATFRNAIKNESVLRQYLAIMGDAYLYDTTITNRDYERVLNEQLHRYEMIPITSPYVDDAYRQTLHERLTAQLANRGLSGAMKAALTNSEMSDAVIKKVQKELGDNARFYRNILALLMKRQDMLPDSLITGVKGLDIPSRTNLDMMSVTEFADLAKKVNNERLRQKILSGSAKFGTDEDQKMYKELVSYTKQLDKDIQAKAKEIENLEKKGEAYEKKVEELEALNKERTQILLDADEIFNVLADTYSPDIKNREFRQEAVKKYNELKNKYDLLSPERELEHQSAETQRQRNTKIKDGSIFRDAKEGGHAGWRQQYRGAKYGSEAWVKEVATNYADIKDRIEAECDKDKRKAYRDVARSVIEEVRKEVLQELNDARVDLISSSVSALARNSNKIYSTLSAIKAVTEGTGTVISNADLEALKASEKELTNELNREQRKVANREEKIEKAELLGRLRLSKEKHEQKLKLIDAIKEGKEATKEALREQRKQHEEDIKDLRAEQDGSVN